MDDKRWRARSIFWRTESGFKYISKDWNDGTEISTGIRNTKYSSGNLSKYLYLNTDPILLSRIIKTGEFSIVNFILQINSLRIYDIHFILLLTILSFTIKKTGVIWNEHSMISRKEHRLQQSQRPWHSPSYYPYQLKVCYLICTK